MRIVQVNPGCGIPIPPNGWGAIEKIVWEYHTNLKKVGHHSEILFLDDVRKEDWDVVHIHVANLAIMAKARGIPYFFSFHDHHAYLHGKDSQVYKENKEAIDGSITSFVPAKYLVDYFESDKVRYFSHGVNTDQFHPCACKKVYDFLCVANNGWAHDPTYDRKGFTMAIELARSMRKSIVVAGPSKNNKEFFRKHPELTDYDGLVVQYDLTEQQLAQVYKMCRIFLHPSELEAGHPNLTLLEAMATGLPVVGTYEYGNKLGGMIRIERDMPLAEVEKEIEFVEKNYTALSKEARQQAEELNWMKRTMHLVKEYEADMEPKQERLHVYHTLGGKKIDLRHFKYNMSQAEVEREYGWEACMYWANIYHHELDNKYFKIEKGDVYVDLGSNIGMNATYAEVMGASKIYCAEPEPEVFQALKKNAGENWVVENVAISDKPGVATIGRWPDASRKTYAKALTLEQFMDKHGLEKIDYLKIDIEGAEQFVIPSIQDQTWKKIKKVFIEYHEDHFEFSDEKRNSFLDSIKKHGFEAYVERGNNQSWMYFLRKDQDEQPRGMKEFLLDAYRYTTTGTPPPVFTKPTTTEPVINYHFINGAFVEILTNKVGPYKVDFIDQDSGMVVYSDIIPGNNYVQTPRQYYTNYKIDITDQESGAKWTKTLDLKGQNVVIELTSKSLGDTLAWMPYCEEFRKKHECKLFVTSFFNEFFQDAYSEIQWRAPGCSFPHIYAQYQIGWWYKEDHRPDMMKHKTDFLSFPLQKTASDILGLEYREIKPILDYYFSFDDRPVEGKYVCIASHSTSQAKYWNHPGGWQQVVDHLKGKGYEVVLLSKEKDGHNGNKNPSGVLYPTNYSLDTIMWHLYHCEYFIGLGSGLSWLSWAMNKTTVLISGFSEPYSEMQDCIRISTPDGKCRGCFNWIRLQNDGFWNWCPKHFQTERAFECSKSITPEMVIEKLPT